MSGNQTIFDRILAKEIPANLAFENESVLAFHDIAPQAPVHVLVIPKRKVARISDLGESDDSASQLGVLFAGAVQTAQHLGLVENGYRLVVNCGKDGQQTVDYLHVHILGGRPLHWPPG